MEVTPDVFLRSLSSPIGAEEHLQAWVGSLGEQGWHRKKDAVSQTGLTWTLLKVPQGCLGWPGLLLGACFRLVSSCRLFYVDSGSLSIWSIPCVDYINNLGASTVDMESEIQSPPGRFQSSRHKARPSIELQKTYNGGSWLEPGLDLEFTEYRRVSLTPDLRPALQRHSDYWDERAACSADQEPLQWTSETARAWKGPAQSTLSLWLSESSYVLLHEERPANIPKRDSCLVISD